LPPPQVGPSSNIVSVPFGSGDFQVTGNDAIITESNQSGGICSMESVVIKGPTLFHDRRGRLGETFRENRGKAGSENDPAAPFRLD
jgi:hypothetical protein